MEIQVKGIIKSVISTTKEGLPLVKKRADGTFSRYDLCSVELTEGPLMGQAVWANRTLQNSTGIDKEAVAEGQEVLLYGNVVDGKPLFTVATGATVASDADILSMLFGVTVGATAASAGVKEPF